MTMTIEACSIAADKQLQPIIADMLRLFNVAVSGRLEIGLEVKAFCCGPRLFLEVYWEDGDCQRGQLFQEELPCNEAARRAEASRFLRVRLFRLLRQLTGYDPGPWGILRGVRPVKLIHKFIDQGYDLKAIEQHLIKDYLVAPAKAHLLETVASAQRQFFKDAYDERHVSIYIGIPFCPSRCLYCSFPAEVLPAANNNNLQLFFAAIEQDIQSVVKFIIGHHLRVDSVYIGGGTPTSLSAIDFQWLLSLVSRSFITAAANEFTVEAGRPDSIDEAKLAVMADNAVTRISINPQTMDDATLRLIGRKHTVNDIVKSIAMARKYIGIINMDVIAGLPGEDTAVMDKTLAAIQALSPDNLTVHTLAVKNGSRLKEHFEEYALPDEHITAAMLFHAEQAAKSMGMKPYYLYRQKHMTGNLENIGYACPGTESFYNVQIMSERQTIIGIGPAAGTKAVDPLTHRLKNSYNAKDVYTYVHNIDRYISKRQAVLAEIYAACKEDGYDN